MERVFKMEDSLSSSIEELYQIVARLESMYPGRKFTLDGPLVGSIGEVIAKERYGLELLPSSSERHDAVAKDGRMVQIKATQINSEPEYLIVLKLDKRGQAEEIYNGPGKPAWDGCGRMQKNGQRAISLAKLRRLMKGVLESGRIAAASTRSLYK